MSIRIARVNDQIREELSRLLRRGLRSGRLGFVTITEVKAAPDLRSARVYVSVFGSDGERAESLRALGAAAGWLRGELGRALRLRTIPELRFVEDRSLETGSRIDSLLDSLARPEPAGETGPESGTGDAETAAAPEGAPGEAAGESGSDGAEESDGGQAD